MTGTPDSSSGEEIGKAEQPTSNQDEHLGLQKAESDNAALIIITEFLSSDPTIRIAFPKGRKPSRNHLASFEKDVRRDRCAESSCADAVKLSRFAVTHCL